MCKSRITAKKFAKLFFEYMFYHIVIAFIFYLTGYETFSFIAFIKVLIPVKSIAKGFTSSYLLFFLLIPFLNILVNHLNEKQHRLLLAWCSFTYIFLGTVPGFSVTMNYVSWFCVLYVIASYIRLYPKKIYEKTSFLGLLTLVFVFLSMISVVGCAWIGTLRDGFDAFYFVTDSNTFLAVAVGVCSFMFFKNLKIRYCEYINIVASSTFGVLLIHAASDTMRQWLWNDILDSVGHYNSPIMPLYAIGTVILIFVVCVIIDQVRIRLIEKPFFIVWDKHVDQKVVLLYKKMAKGAKLNHENYSSRRRICRTFPCSPSRAET